jgi:hypothetical protein
MKAIQSALRFNELLCCSSSLRRAEHLHFLGDNVIAEIEFHVLPSRVDSTHIGHQPTSRILPSTLQSHDRGAAGVLFDCTRCGDITPELTRADEQPSIYAARKDDEKHSIEASDSMSCYAAP